MDESGCGLCKFALSDASGAADFHSYRSVVSTFQHVLGSGRTCVLRVPRSARKACPKTFFRGMIAAHQTRPGPGLIDKTSISSTLDGLEMVAGNATHKVEHRTIDEVMALGSWLLAHTVVGW